MSRGPVKIEADGTRVYAGGRRYLPKGLQPEGEGQWFGSQWITPLPLIDDEQRTMPATKPFRDPPSPGSRSRVGQYP